MECVFNDHNVENVKYLSTTLKSSMIGWMYKLPNNNNKVIMLSDIIPNPSFYMTSWKKLSECISTEEIIEVLEFSSNYSNDEIIKTIQNHILSLLEKYADKEDKKSMNIIKALKENFETDEELDYNEKIIFNLDENVIENE
jgi:hypothetical protein